MLLVLCEATVPFPNTIFTPWPTWDKEQFQYIPPARFLWVSGGAARQSFRYAARDSLESGQAAGELEVLPSQLRALPW